jgi:hypothetical protein
MQRNPNMKIYKMASSILVTYFETEDETGTNGGTNVMGS